jgi:2-oxoglutarate ferredoxin oxidoreductase subunit beta
MTDQRPPEKLTAKDFASDQEVRWCPGCGDYAILKGVQKTLADIEADPANTVFISGIGCAARFPYYIETYGFHTIHGRAAALATGAKLANPDLDVWIVGGDGDSLSIGGNHLMHLLRRNLDCQYLLFNNEIYGLTKGQYSPTSHAGTRSPSTPFGSLDQPVSAARFALGANATFVARTGDVMQAHLVEMLKRAHGHKGTGFVEILQNCIVYNDHVFGHIMDKEVQADAQIHLAHGAPMLFGPDGKKGLRLKPGKLALEAVTLGEAGITEADILVHDETDATMAFLLAAMEPPALPVAMGVLYAAETGAEDTYDGAMRAFRARRIEQTGGAHTDLDAVMRQGHTWTVS